MFRVTRFFLTINNRQCILRLAVESQDQISVPGLRSEATDLAIGINADYPQRSDLLRCTACLFSVLA